MPKLITVFGATGNQGGSVVKYILNDLQLNNEFKIRGITRDTSKPAAQELAKQGVELATADLNSTDSLRSGLQGSDVIFLVTNYWETKDGALELQQGKNVTDVAKELGVSRLIFSSLHHITEESNGRLSHVAHFDSKANIEKYIRASGIDCTFFMPGYYMSNLKTMLKKGDDGAYSLSLPVSATTKFPLFDAAHDTGLFVGAALKHADSLQGKRILGSGAYYTSEDIVNTFCRVLEKKATFKEITAEEYKATKPPEIAVENLENQLFVEDPGYFLGASLEPTLELLDAKPTTFAQFLEREKLSWD